MIQKASIVYELPIIVCWNKIYSTSMMSLYSIIQDHTINQCTWLLVKKPSYRQEWMSSLQIRYSKRGYIDEYSKCDRLHSGELWYTFLDQTHISWASFKSATNGLQYYTLQSTTLPTELSWNVSLRVIKFIIN